MLPAVIQCALVLLYAAVALWSAVNSVLEHSGDRIDLREMSVIAIVSLFWIVFYAAALLLIAFRFVFPPGDLIRHDRTL